jgi:hypothetical protein
MIFDPEVNPEGKKSEIDLERSLMKKEIKLYNIIFPIWSIFLIPIGWIVVLPANFIIDSVVFIAALAVLRISDKKTKYRKCILRIWGYGFLADIIGAGFLFILLFFDYFGSNIAYNPLSSPIAFIVTSIGVILAGICIYLFNYTKVLPLIDLEDHQRKKIAIIIAVLTMPYTMYIPTSLFA